MTVIQLEIQESVARITMNNPPVNALTSRLFCELEAVLEEVQANEKVASVVLTGGGKCFSAGLDLGFASSYDDDQRHQLINDLNSCIKLLYGFSKPTIAAINGHAIAGGTVVALACDYRIGVEGSGRMGLTEVRVAIPFPVGARVVVETELDPCVRRRLMLTGETISFEKALSSGLLDEQCEHDRLGSRAHGVATDLAGIPRRAFAQMKMALRRPALEELAATIKAGRDPMFEQLDLETARNAAARLLKKP